MNIDLGRKNDYGGWWIHVDRQIADLYMWRWMARRFARKIAAAHGAVRVHPAHRPYKFGLTMFLPFESWEAPDD